MNRYYLIIFVVFTSLQSFAHKDIVIQHKYGNVKIATKTGFYYEEINKTLIIGQYAQLLCEKLNFKDTITIFFKHNYIKNASSKFNIEKSKSKHGRRFFITYESSSFDFAETLNIVEYIILNKSKSLKCNLDKKSQNAPSNLITEVLSLKIYRPLIVEKLNSNNTLSYYVQNSKYSLFYLDNVKQNCILELKDVYQLSFINLNSSIVFDSNKSFYYLNKDNRGNLRRNDFNSKDFYMPFNVEQVSQNLIEIEMVKFQSEKEILTFNIETGLLSN